MWSRNSFKEVKKLSVQSTGGILSLFEMLRPDRKPSMGCHSTPDDQALVLCECLETIIDIILCSGSQYQPLELGYTLWLSPPIISKQQDKQNRNDLVFTWICCFLRLGYLRNIRWWFSEFWILWTGKWKKKNWVQYRVVNLLLYQIKDVRLKGPW